MKTKLIKNKVSILLPAFKRPILLGLGLSSLLYHKPTCDFEIIVLNDGIIDDTEHVCEVFKERGLPIKYVFTGKRNLDGVIKSRVPGFALNIGIKLAEGNMIVLSCPEMWHLNNTIDMLVKALLENPKGLIIPKRVFFDKEGDETNKLTLSSNSYPEIDEENLLGDKYGYENATMPFLMAMYKQELIDINGYDEDFIGYAGEDNDLIGRLKVNGLNHVRTLARVVHLYHGNHNNSLCHYDNPEWVYNYKLLQDRMGIVKRNVGKKWGIL